jgi:hypothetical protein
MPPSGRAAKKSNPTLPSGLPLGKGKMLDFSSSPPLGRAVGFDNQEASFLDNA